MPPEPQPEDKAPPTHRQLKHHLQKLCNDRLMQGDLRRHVVPWLLEQKRGGRWDRKPRPSAKQIFCEFYDYARINFGAAQPKDTEVNGRKLFSELVEALKQYYAGPGADDNIIITLQGGVGGGYEPMIEWRSEVPLVLTTRRSGPVVEPGGVTIYSNWDKFEELLNTVERDHNQPEDLRIISISFTSGGPPEDKLQELAERGIRIKILLTDPIAGEPIVRARNKIRSACKDGDGETQEDALDALRAQIGRLENLRNVLTEKKRNGCLGDLELRLSELMPYAFVAHTSKWIVLGLFLANCSYGLGPMIVIDVATHTAFSEKLRSEWEARSAHALTTEEALRQHRLSHNSHSRESIIHQIVGDSVLITEIEAQTPDGADIWVAAPDLSNVGDRMSSYSELVRRVVRENAGRGVNYTYICPQGWAGHSRLEILNECFTKMPGKLYVHEVPVERFLEITLVPSHFISFNPRAEKADAYMQLPLPQSQKGWIALGPKDAARVLAKMKQLISEYPTAPGPQS